MVVALSLRELYESDIEERQVAIYTAWLLVRAKDPSEPRNRLFSANGRERTVFDKAFQMLVEQYEKSMRPLYRGQPSFVLFNEADEVFSKNRKMPWRTLRSLGFEFTEPDDDSKSRSKEAA